MTMQRDCPDCDAHSSAERLRRAAEPGRVGDGLVSVFLLQQDRQGGRRDDRPRST